MIGGPQSRRQQVGTAAELRALSTSTAVPPSPPCPCPAGLLGAPQPCPHFSVPAPLRPCRCGVSKLLTDGWKPRAAFFFFSPTEIPRVFVAREPLGRERGAGSGRSPGRGRGDGALCHPGGAVPVPAGPAHPGRIASISARCGDGRRGFESAKMGFQSSAESRSRTACCRSNRIGVTASG